MKNLKKMFDLIYFPFVFILTLALVGSFFTGRWLVLLLSVILIGFAMYLRYLIYQSVLKEQDQEDNKEEEEENSQEA